MNKLLITAAFSLCLLTLHSTLPGQVRLPVLIRDSMVIQRDVDLKIWGWADVGERVSVKFQGKNYKTKTASDGKWYLKIPPMKAGGPYTMVIAASNRITIHNILVGDVWICAGQSNMVHYLELHKDRYAEEIAGANFPEIRQFLIPTSTRLEGPVDDLSSGSWKSANPEDVRRFSVVAYFFALGIYEKHHVPIGLINASVGGTPIEAWTSEEGLKEFPDMLNTIQKNRDTAYVNRTKREAMASRREAMRNKGVDRGLAGPLTWYDTSYTPQNWHNIHIPGYWEDQGVRDLDGVVWYRKEIEIPASMTGVPAKIELGRIVDADKLFINGRQAGQTTYQYPQRRYTVPAGVLKPGKNLFVIRVVNNMGKGGFVPDKPYYLSAAGQTINLQGDWQYRVGQVFSKARISPGGISAQHQPTALFNAMIAPLTNYAIKGFLWYQGESNESRPAEYKKLVPALILDWRRHWELGEVPFLCVQLPKYMDVNYSPEESNWALLREAQLESMELTNTGMAVTLDLGEWNDIHPGNKKPVGDRLALWARKLAYGEQDLICSGPIYRSYSIEGNKMTLTFDHVGSGLMSGNGEELDHFAIAGPDKKYKWGRAIIKDNTVVVWNDDIQNPVYVRYAWADNPDFANLFNQEGLPASPFQTGE